jgi:hypothetical protein
LRLLLLHYLLAAIIAVVSICGYALTGDKAATELDIKKIVAMVYRSIGIIVAIIVLSFLGISANNVIWLSLNRLINI